MASTTLGVKVDDALRDRLKAAAQKLNCTPHWLHKQAILAYLDKIERGHLPAEMSHLRVAEGVRTTQATIRAHCRRSTTLAQDVVQPRPRAAARPISRRPTAALSRNASRCCWCQARACAPGKCRAQASGAPAVRRPARQAGTGGGVEGLIQEFSPSRPGKALLVMCPPAEALLRIPDRATRDALIRDKVARGDWRAHVGRSPSLFVNARHLGPDADRQAGVHPAANRPRRLR